MAFAEGGTAGSSVSHGNGSMGAAGGPSNGGHQGSDSQGGKGNGSSTGSKSSTGPAATSARASASASDDSNKSTGGIMGGLMSSVAAARAPSSSVSGSIRGAVNSAFAGNSPAGKSMGTGAKGYGNDTAGSVANAVGAMNTPQAQEKAQKMGVAERQGFRDESNAGLTSGAFGLAGSTPASLAGKAIGAVMSSNPYGKKTDEASAYAAGKALAKQEGVGPAARVGAGVLGSVLGGPVGGMLMDALTSAASYGLQRSYHPSAFDSSVTPGRPGATEAGPGGNFSGNSGNSSGGMNEALAAPIVGSTTPQPASKFEQASDFDRGSYRALNLLDILR